MEQKERALKDLQKLEKIIQIAKSLGYDQKYPEVYEHAANYQKDAIHFFEKNDYFTSFGAANYAYGFIDALLILEGKRDEHVL
ncbi:DUF357 domain-containing protein [Candidatus Micrarchaeota archaeon]|nr:DUF357 domain-containing protein [Candidatus Micrarchaeota archaeon]